MAAHIDKLRTSATAAAKTRQSARPWRATECNERDKHWHGQKGRDNRDCLCAHPLLCLSPALISPSECVKRGYSPSLLPTTIIPPNPFRSDPTVVPSASVRSSSSSCSSPGFSMRPSLAPSHEDRLPGGPTLSGLSIRRKIVSSLGSRQQGLPAAAGWPAGSVWVVGETW
ncbi:hypothetical protein L227DRAFT_208470 [Lentinus tigrinus ALCF2SS1-6]|uniref:Uncharacterized protein n=1 Tax=Lentinus tigrinus ALCF2SS1-6 TaxID=1328759 RepID=A0A5C2SNX9_9APHY|nr:hypothetical protein L227DRAFT_208470 [Lentinus tigrinus ALCF2SS1-6]